MYTFSTCNNPSQELKTRTLTCQEQKNMHATKEQCTPWNKSSLPEHIPCQPSFPPYRLQQVDESTRVASLVLFSRQSPTMPWHTNQKGSSYTKLPIRQIPTCQAATTQQNLSKNSTTEITTLRQVRASVRERSAYCCMTAYRPPKLRKCSSQPYLETREQMVQLFSREIPSKSS